MKKLISSLAASSVAMTLLVLAIVLVYAGTWAQIDTGIHEVQQNYFHSWVARIPLGVCLPRLDDGHMAIPGSIPFPGGYTIGLLMVINLLANWLTRFRLAWKHAGIHLIHLGLVILLVGEAWTSISQVDALLTLAPGQRLNYVIDTRHLELAVIDRKPAEYDRVWSIRGNLLQSGAMIEEPELPVSLKIERFAPNSELAGPMQNTPNGEALANSGAAVGVKMWPLARAGGAGEEVDTPSAFVTVYDQGISRGTFLLSFWTPFTEPQKVTLGDGHELWLQLRPKRLIKPYEVELVKFTHDRFAGTSMAKSFSSRVRLIDNERGVDREEVIWMNHPLRYRGDTLYQSGFRGEDVTQLQVVHNPAMLIPYIACIIGTVGMAVHFAIVLAGFLRKRKNRVPGAQLHEKPAFSPAAIIAPATFGLVCLACMIGQSFKAAVSTYDLAQAPAYFDGRLQPLDSIGRNALRMMSGKASVTDADGKAVAPADFLLNVMTQPETAAKYPVFRIDNADVLSALKLPVDKKLFSLADLEPARDVLMTQTDQASQIPANHRDLVQRQFIDLANKAALYDKLHDVGEMRLLPPSATQRDWQTIAQAMQDGKGNPASQAIMATLGARADGRDSDTEAASRQWIRELNNSRPDDMNRMQMELFYNRFEPFLTAIYFYLLAFLLSTMSLLFWQRPLFRSATVVGITALLLHTAGICVRMYLQGRPPVTNLYSSAILIGWAAVVFALLVEWVYRNGVSLAMSSLVAVASLIVAQNLAQGDTMGSLQAVLDSNFWLATHVITITLGYAAVFMAGALAISYVLFARGMSEEKRKSRMQAIYAISCFAMFFSFIGTILGGIWADQSWGRFWGWDPKENGAVLIVLWLAIVLHWRYAGGKDRGLALMAIFGNIVTAWSWFGTNMLGVGLHSYGFMDNALKWLLIFVVSQLVLIALGWFIIPTPAPKPAEVEALAAR
jgi:ABC-type transport system involved in cytochrome c biogenesis permease subunit